MKASHQILRGLALVGLAGVTVTGCNAISDDVDTNPAIVTTGIAAGGHAYDPGTVLVKFRDAPSIASRQSVLGLVNGKVQDKDLDGKDDRFLNVSGGRLALVELSGSTVEHALAVLQQHPDVEFAEPNWIVYPELTPNDTSYTDLWGMNNTGQLGGTVDADIDAPEAWDISTGDSSVIVGVIDTGIDYTHPDLVDNMWTNPGEIDGNGVDDDGNGYIDDVHGINAIVDDGDPMDDHSHGTHCSGTIGARGNNGVGVVGVNWDVSLAACKFLSASGGTTADGVQCVDYFVDLKVNRSVDVRVLSNSWGGGGFSQALEDAIAAADAADMLFVAAAGNTTNDNDAAPHYPSSYEVPNVLAVASTTRNDTKSGFSSFGLTSVDLGAPGSDILSTTPGNTYSTFSGTSMATPHVSGVAALVLSVNPALLDTELKDLLMDTGDPIPALSNNTVSGNRLNAEAALLAADPSPTFRVNLTPSSETINQGQSTTYAISVDALNGYVGTVNVSLATSPTLNATVTFSSNSIVAGSTATFTVDTTTNTTAGDYDLTITASDGTITKSASASLTVYPQGTEVRFYDSTDTPISIPDNQSSGITSTLSVPDGLTMSNVKVTVDITHTYIGDLIVRVTSPGGTTVSLHNQSGGSANDLHQTYALPSEFDDEVAQGDWTLFVSDNAGIDLGTLDHWSLEITGVAGDLSPHASFSHETVDLTAYFTDASSVTEGIILTRQWNFGDGSTSTLKHPSHTYADAGTYTVTLTVTDDSGTAGVATRTVTVTAPPSIDLVVAETIKVNATLRIAELLWTGGATSTVEIYRDGIFVDLAPNNGGYRDAFLSFDDSFTYEVCETGTGVCSRPIDANF